jgi:hypothetical protein
MLAFRRLHGGGAAIYNPAGLMRTLSPRAKTWPLGAGARRSLNREKRNA